MIVFFGSDLPSELTGLAGRAELARGMVAIYRLDPDLSLPAAAEQLVFAGSHLEYLQYIRRVLTLGNPKPAPWHRAMARLRPQAIITTAYDTLIEQAFRQAGTRLDVVYEDEDLPRIDPTRSTALIRLYGSLDRSDSLIVTEADQRALRQGCRRQALVSYAQKLLRSHPALLFGYDFTAPDVEALWRELLAERAADAPPLFAVAAGPGGEDQRQWEQRGLVWLEMDSIKALEAFVMPSDPARAAPAGPLPSPPQPPRAPLVFGYDQRPRTSADLEIWLRGTGEGLPERPVYEAIVSFRPARSMLVVLPVADPPPRLTLDLQQLRELQRDPVDYGAALAGQCFADEGLRNAVADIQQQTRQASAALRVRWRLDTQDPRLHTVRWELIQAPHANEFLALAPDTYVSRFLAGPDALAPAALDRRWPPALAAIAAPSDLARYQLEPIDLQRATRHAREALQRYDTEPLPDASLVSLAERLQRRASVLYLIAHGAVHGGRALLYLEDSHGATKVAPAEEFAQLIARSANRPPLVVLAACTTAGVSDAPEHALSTLGPLLALAGVGAVVAMHDQVTIETVEASVPTLFEQLQQHGAIDQAVAAMRAALASRGAAWWQPVLYMRLQDGLLW